MFGLFKKERGKMPLVMGKEVTIASITRDGKVLYTDETVNKYPIDHLEGKIIEVAFTTRSGNPYFIYYLCHDYYVDIAHMSGQGNLRKAQETEAFRTEVSQKAGIFLVSYLKNVVKVDARSDLKSFSHNRLHTNVLAYIQSLGEWYPVQHCDAESDDASELKVEKVNKGLAPVSDIIAVTSPSPSG